VISGLTSTLAHVGGPPVTVYLMRQELTPRALVATSDLFFSLLNLIKLSGYFITNLINPATLQQNLWTLPLIPIGVLVGRWTVDRVDKSVFDAILTLLLALSAILLIVR